MCGLELVLVRLRVRIIYHWWSCLEYWGFFLIGKQEELFRALCYKLGFLVAVIIIIIIIIF